MYTALINTRKTASQDIQPVMNATSHPDVRPLITEPTKAERMALKALAAGERVHSEPAEGEADNTPGDISAASTVVLHSSFDSFFNSSHDSSVGTAWAFRRAGRNGRSGSGCSRASTAVRCG